MKYAAIVLAAGRGERFGGNKLQALLNGRSLLEHAIGLALAAPVETVVVVTRPGTVLPDEPRLRAVELPSACLSESLRAGLAHTGDPDGAFIFLGDMPLIPQGTAEALAAAIGSAVAAFPMHGDVPGHPLLLARRGFALADELVGDEGIGRMLRARDDVVRLPTTDCGVIADVDTKSALAALQQRR